MRIWSTSVSMMFREFALLDRFMAARKAGFVGAEIQVLAEGDPQAMGGAARAAEMDVVLINVGMGDYLSGGSGLSGVPGREETFRAEMDKALSAAMALGARFIHLGPSRIPQGEDRERCLGVYRSNIDYAMGEHGRRGVGGRVLIEPMNRVETPDALINDIDTGADFIRTHYPGGLGLQFDIYHVAMNGADPVEAFARTADVTAHVQFSDMPGRQPPGDGTLDFARIFDGLERAGYKGWFGAEYMPRTPTLETLDWMQRLG
ncbi:MAG: TIM barrel protein [Hyphomonadaceae bacterium]|nr:TIM barrel protein [Hyphomonadaceae bacterium]GIK50251.1 MAG: hydroxypyruvate isomerase [Alphaproteobacteria bacterium]